MGSNHLMLFVLSFLISVNIINTAPISKECEAFSKLDSVRRFREYLRIDTSKEENIQYALEFLIRQAKEVGIPYKVYTPAGKPIFVATIEGRNSSLPSILLNSHMDVVKVDESEWKYPPFAAHMDENCDIYARGAQDTKDVGMQYFEAIRKLKQDNVTLERTLHISVMPDEETGGVYGMDAFVQTDDYKRLNIGFALDEGLASSDDSLLATYVDRRPWQMQFTFHGAGGHGLSIPDDSAMEKTQKFINIVMAYRETQKEIMKTKNPTDFTGYSSVNINMIQGGLATNIIPSEITAVVDMRLAPDANIVETQTLIDSWLEVTGNATEFKYLRHVLESRATAVDDTNPYWLTLRDTLANMGIKVNPVICPATSDMVTLRNLGIPALGFTTKSNTISHIHGKDEYQNVEIFLRGIDIYKEVVKNLGNML